MHAPCPRKSHCPARSPVERWSPPISPEDRILAPRYRVVEDGCHEHAEAVAGQQGQDQVHPAQVDDLGVAADEDESDGPGGRMQQVDSLRDSNGRGGRERLG